MCLCLVGLWRFLEIVIVEVAQKDCIEGFILFRPRWLSYLSEPIHHAEYAGTAYRDGWPLSGLWISSSKGSAPVRLKVRLLHLFGRFACWVFAWFSLRALSSRIPGVSYTNAF